MSRETRQQLLEDVGNCILQDRAATHGEPEDSFNQIVDYWNTYLAYRYPNHTLFLGGEDVAMMMALLKIARATINPHHRDNYVDAAGYLLLTGEKYGL